jgi:hypothetical protein
VKNSIPTSWKYSQDLENLFYFYQCSEELMSQFSPDSFRLPVCNALQLCYEIKKIYGILHGSNQIERYYSKYIPCILEELIYLISKDIQLKRQLGDRLDSITMGLETAKQNPSLLLRWVHLINQSCSLNDHFELYKSRIVELVKENINKIELYKCISEFYIDIIVFGYSHQYVYQCTIRFFDNWNKEISSTAVIDDFLNLFNIQEKEHEFIICADTFGIDNLNKVIPELERILSIQKLQCSDIEGEASSSQALRQFIDEYKQHNPTGNPKNYLLSCKSSALDPYSAFSNIERVFDLVQSFDGYFKHKTERRVIYDILHRTEGGYSAIKPRSIIPKRPFIEQEIIDRRIETLLSNQKITRKVMASLSKALDMHFDAINCKNPETMLRSFWSAFESFFFEESSTIERENTKYGILHIVQKTFLLKQFRIIYSQLKQAIDNPAYWQALNIKDFRSFLVSFFSKVAGTEDFKLFTNELANNPLLRSRLFNIRKEYNDKDSVLKKIESHRKKVAWHIDRIYRTRNLSTHAGIKLPYINDILYNVHNYFDYVINYIICKLENDQTIIDITSVVFEAKNDNELHISSLQSCNEAITPANCFHVLFGPDQNIIDYDFEVSFSED